MSVKARDDYCLLPLTASSSIVSTVLQPLSRYRKALNYYMLLRTLVSIVLPSFQASLHGPYCKYRVRISTISYTRSCFEIKKLFFFINYFDVCKRRRERELCRNTRNLRLIVSYIYNDCQLENVNSHTYKT